MGKLFDLVSLLSGRNFEARTFETEITEQSFEKLKNSIVNFTNETNFKRKDMKLNSIEIEKFIKRWFVYSILTGRYSSSPESMFDYDIKQISTKPMNEYLKEKEEY